MHTSAHAYIHTPASAAAESASTDRPDPLPLSPCAAICVRQPSLRELWPSLLALAESWSRAREPPLVAAASCLYVEMFVGGDGALERQQVLQALHGHLGSCMAGEQDAALQVC